MRKLLIIFALLISIALTGCSYFLEPVDPIDETTAQALPSTDATIPSEPSETVAPTEPIPSITRLDEFTLNSPNIIEIYDWVDPDTHVHYLIVFDRYKQQITSVTPRYANPSQLIDNDVPSLTTYEDGFENGKSNE